LKKRTSNEYRAYYALFPLLHSQPILRTEEVEFCKTLIRPDATYE